MKQQIKDSAIILRRTNYSEADRVVTLLTANNGKMSAMAKGVRKAKSKLAGGLELFAVTEVTLLPGKGEVATITSARMHKFYGAILHDFDRMQFAYECVKLVGNAAETIAEPELFELLNGSLAYLDAGINTSIVEVWFRLQYLQILGTGINVAADVQGAALQAEARYDFNFAEGAFALVPSGRFGAEHIKYLRLASVKKPDILRQVSGVDEVLQDCQWLVRRLMA